MADPCMTKGCSRCESCLHKLCTRSVPIFASLPQEDLSRIVERIHHRDYLKGERILSEGAPAEFVAILSEGRAKAYRDSADGREQILYLFDEGDFFGETHLLSQPAPSTYSVEALETVRACLLYRRDFLQLLRDYPDMGIRVIGELSARLSRLEHAVQRMGTGSLDARIAATLLEFGDKYGRRTPDGVRIRLPLSREGMAGYLGIARETVSRKLGQMEQDGLLRSIGHKTLVVRDPDALARMAGEGEFSES